MKTTRKSWMITEKGMKKLKKQEKIFLMIEVLMFLDVVTKRCSVKINDVGGCLM